jgi:subtilase family serine protease
MSKKFLKAGVGLLILAGLTGPLTAAAADKMLHGHVPSVLSKLTQTGAVASTNRMHLAIGLQVRNEAALDDLVQQVSDPSSPNYQHYLTPAEFTQQFAPTEADYQAVIAFAKAHGLTVTATAPNRMLVEVDGTAENVQKAFKVALHTYHHPSENRNFFAPDSEPSVPAGLPILDVSGLNNYARPHTHLHFRSNATNSPAAKAAPRSTTANLGSGPQGSYMGNDFRAAYVPGASQTGVGQNVALVQFDGYFASDISLYESLNGLPNVTLTNILLNGFSGFPTFTGGEVEVSLDIEMVISMAPHINEVLVYEGNPFNFFPNTVLNQIAVDNSARQISSSWGWNGGPSATTDQIFKEMILQGQTYYNASGDSDAFLPGEVDNPGFIGVPSSDPYITQVGATTLSTTAAGGPYASETVWNWGNEFPGQGYDGVGSSGGISSYYAIPSWQTNANMLFNGGSTVFRNIPDVALVGDNVLVIADGGLEYPGVGGTSCAAPLWAGFTALVNQQAAAVGHAPVGFINPTLYALAASPYYTNVFHDTIKGDNTWSASPNTFFAVSNYDLCTGLGTPNGTNLINALTSVTNVVASISGLIPPPKQPWGATLSVMNGADPNGLWLLYIQDDTAPTGGTNYNGWALNLTTADPITLSADNQLYVKTTINSQAYGDATNVFATPGSVWHTTLAVTNYGQALSSNVFVTATLPMAPAVTVISSNTTVGLITNFGNTLIWNVGNLSVNSGATLSLNMQINNNGVYTNSATVSALTTDPNPDDDSVLVIATVAPTAPPILLPLLSTSGDHALSLSITNDSGSKIIIQASTNLTSWLPITTNISPFTFTTYDVTNYQQRFYRAVIGQ